MVLKNARVTKWEKEGKFLRHCRGRVNWKVNVDGSKIRGNKKKEHRCEALKIHNWDSGTNNYTKGFKTSLEKGEIMDFMFTIFRSRGRIDKIISSFKYQKLRLVSQVSRKKTRGYTLGVF